MTIQEQLQSELKDAMKTKDKPRLNVIRQVQTEVATAKSQPDFDGPVDDSLYEKVIASYVKKMDKARKEYEAMGDKGESMASQLAYEVEYLGQWLPKALGEEETLSLVQDAIAQLGVSGDEKAAGRVIGHLMKERGSDLDGGMVNRLVREELARG